MGLGQISSFFVFHTYLSEKNGGFVFLFGAGEWWLTVELPWSPACEMGCFFGGCLDYV
jgi:hypothetical protein